MTCPRRVHTGLHLRFLFNTTGSGLDASLKTQSLGRQSLQRSLEQYSHSRSNSHATSPVTSRSGSRVGTPERGSRVGSRGPDRGYRSRSGSDASFHDEAAQRLVAHTNDDPPSPRDAGPPDRLFTPPSTDERPLMNHSASKGRSRRKR